MASDLFNRAQEALRRGDDALVIRLLEGLPASALDDASSFCLGAAYHRQGRLQEAERTLAIATARQTRNLQAWLARVAVLLDLKDSTGAVEVCRDACVQFPANAEVWFSLAVTREATEDFSEALTAYETALSIDPGHKGALQNKAARLLSLARFQEAVEAARNFSKRYPYAHVAQFMHGDVCLSAGLHDEAAAAFFRAEALRPNDATSLLHAGFALSMSERFDEAQRILDRVASMDPDLLARYRRTIFNEQYSIHPLPRLEARALFLLRHYDRIEMCDWSARDYFLKRFSELINAGATGQQPLTERALGFRAMAMGINSREQLSLARQLASSIASNVKAPVFTNPAGKPRRIRIGYVSPDFRMHPIGLMTSKLYGWHDRSRFEVLCFSLGGDDGSEVRCRIEAECDRFTSLESLSDEESARLIAADGVDILVDLTGYTDSARPGIFAARPAPVQVSWLGYLATMGTPCIDYVVADEVCIPERDAAFFSEAIMRVPAGYYLCSYANDPVSPSPTRLEAGLPEQRLVLAAMHNHYKIDPEIFSLWMGVLRRHQDSVLWLLQANDSVVGNLKRSAEMLGVESSRLVFAPKLPHARHLARLQLADLVLDTPQCNGSTTICDALVSGVPVVSCLGDTFGQRVAASVLGAAGLSHWVVEDTAGYEQLVGQILASDGARSSAKQAIEAARASAVFFQPEQWVRYLEEGFEAAWKNYLAGKPAVAIKVPG